LDFGIRGRVAMVFGAGGGLGGAMSLALAREGVTVIGCDANAERLDQTVERARDSGAVIVPQVVQLADTHDVDGAIDEIERRFGTVSILVNNTVGPPPSAIGEIGDEMWQRYFSLMVSPVFHVTNRLIPAMREQGWGRVITSASSGVIAPIRHLGISNTLRSSLVGWSKTLANEVSADGVTVNVVLPGRIATGRIKSLDAAKAKREGLAVEDVVAASVGAIPAGRYGTPEEFGDVVAFLASERASYISGTVTRVDGGMVPSVY
jgi:3-oxoacyl-[acyl-carrier protein] reductase